MRRHYVSLHEVSAFGTCAFSLCDTRPRSSREGSNAFLKRRYGTSCCVILFLSEARRVVSSSGEKSQPSINGFCVALSFNGAAGVRLTATLEDVDGHGSALNGSTSYLGGASLGDTPPLWYPAPLWCVVSDSWVCPVWQCRRSDGPRQQSHRAYGASPPAL